MLGNLIIDMLKFHMSWYLIWSKYRSIDIFCDLVMTRHWQSGWTDRCIIKGQSHHVKKSLICCHDFNAPLFTTFQHFWLLLATFRHFDTLSRFALLLDTFLHTFSTVAIFNFSPLFDTFQLFCLVFTIFCHCYPLFTVVSTLFYFWTLISTKFSKFSPHFVHILHAWIIIFEYINLLTVQNSFALIYQYYYYWYTFMYKLACENDLWWDTCRIWVNKYNYDIPAFHYAWTGYVETISMLPFIHVNPCATNHTMSYNHTCKYDTIYTC